MLDRRFLLFDCPDFSHTRTAIQQACQTLQLLGSAGRIHLHPAVIFIAYPATQTDFGRALLYEPPKSDSLHAARNKPAPGFSQTRSLWRRLWVL